jgi:hypothetical protein
MKTPQRAAAEAAACSLLTLAGLLDEDEVYALAEEAGSPDHDLHEWHVALASLACLLADLNAHRDQGKHNEETPQRNAQIWGGEVGL